MSLLTEAQYEEYIGLLRAWVDAEKSLDGTGDADPEAEKRVRQAYDAVEAFRARYGLPLGAQRAAGVEAGEARG